MKNTPESKPTRYLSEIIKKELHKKMVFLGGPRQVGKTYLSQKLMTSKSLYLNWDDDMDRETIRRAQISVDHDLIILDEIHKFSSWRQKVKGLFDKHGDKVEILVTGSARLDHFRRGGDSLVGRYLFYRLHPFSLPELDPHFKNPSETLTNLLEFGGFPEPFLRKDERFLRQWRNNRISRLIREDLRDLKNIQDISKVELLVDQIPSRVGAGLSIKSLHEYLRVSPNTVTDWLTLLEHLYLFFRISPFGSAKIKAVKKTQKIYSWDWGMVPDPGFRFENLVASQLLKHCHFQEDYHGHKMELRYMRDVEGREVDFVILKDKSPVFCVECKSGERQISPHLRYFRPRLKIPKCYQVHTGSADYGNQDTDVRVLPFWKFCQIEGMN